MSVITSNPFGNLTYLREKKWAHLDNIMLMSDYYNR